MARELVLEQYPLFLTELDAVFAEAGVILGLLAASSTRRIVYAHGLAAQTVARLRSRSNDPGHRRQLLALFGTSDDDLEEVLGEAYRRLQTAPRDWGEPPTQLFVDTR